jgi:nucleotide-binding universal stress UspA family protein
MDGQLLVPLRGSDRIEQFLPYIEQIARPGVKVVFLVHLGTGRFQEIFDQLVAIHTGLAPAFLSVRNSDSESLNQRSRLTREEIIRRCKSLREKGVEISVGLFAGPLRTAVREFAQKEDIQLVIMRGATRNWLARILRKIGSVLHLFRPEMLPPVILFHPSSFPGRPR